LRGKRPAGQSESWRDSPRHESCRAIVERGYASLKVISGTKIESDPNKLSEVSDKNVIEFNIIKYF